MVTLRKRGAPATADDDDLITKRATRRSTGSVKEVEDAGQESDIDTDGSDAAEHESDSDAEEQQLDSDAAEDEDASEEDDEDFALAPSRRRSKSSQAKARSARKSQPRKSTNATNGTPGASLDIAATKGAQRYFAAIGHPDAALSEFAQEWARTYAQDQEAAVLELVNVMALAAGYQGPLIDIESFRNTETEQLLQQFIEQFTQTFDGSPPLLEGRQGKQLLANYLEFWRKITRIVGEEHYADEYLAEALPYWLSAFASSPASYMRFAATRAGLEILTTLCIMSQEASTRQSTAQRQLDADKSKTSAKAKRLLESIKDCEERLAALHNLALNMFNGIFVHRYRDTREPIREACIAALGRWILEYPSIFLQDRFMKYVGWTLYDKKPAVRKAAVNVLTKLYKKESFVQMLDLFTRRFKARFVQMATADADSGVQAAAVALLSVLADRDQYEADTSLDKLLLSPEGRIRRTAAELALQQVPEDDARALLNNAGSKRGRGAGGARIPTDGIVALRLIARAVSSDQPIELGLADGLWSAGGPLSCWPALASLCELCVQHEADSSSSKNEHSRPLGTVALSLALACARKAAAQTVVPGDRVRGVLPKPKKAEITALSRAFAAPLARLLTAQRAAADKVAPLLEIAALTIPDVVHAAHDGAVTRILAAAKTAALQHASTEVCTAAGRVFAAYAASDSAFATDACAAARDTFAALCKSIERATADADPHFDESSLETLGAALERVRALQGQVEISGVDLIAPLTALLRSGTLGADETPEEHAAASSAARIVAQDALWAARRALRNSSDESVAQDASARADRAVGAGVDALRAAVASVASPDKQDAASVSAVAVAATGIAASLSQILVLFGDSCPLESLRLRSSLVGDVADALLEFVDAIATCATEHAALLNSDDGAPEDPAEGEGAVLLARAVAAVLPPFRLCPSLASRAARLMVHRGLHESHVVDDLLKDLRRAVAGDAPDARGRLDWETLALVVGQAIEANSLDTNERLAAVASRLASSYVGPRQHAGAVLGIIKQAIVYGAARGCAGDSASALASALGTALAPLVSRLPLEAVTEALREIDHAVETRGMPTAVAAALRGTLAADNSTAATGAAPARRSNRVRKGSRRRLDLELVGSDSEGQVEDDSHGHGDDDAGAGNGADVEIDGTEENEPSQDAPEGSEHDEDHSDGDHSARASRSRKRYDRPAALARKKRKKEEKAS